MFQRDVRFIFPYLFTSVLVMLTIILSLVSLNWQYIPLFIYTCYSFVCILSLCQKIRDEKVTKSINNYQQAPTREWFFSIRSSNKNLLRLSLRQKFVNIFFEICEIEKSQSSSVQKIYLILNWFDMHRVHHDFSRLIIERSRLSKLQ